MLPAKPVDERVLELLQAQPAMDGLYVTPDVPPEKIANATQACKLGDSECVLGMVDCTASGSAEDALVFGCKGVYFHNAAGSKSAGSGYIPYGELGERHLSLGEAREIALGSGQFLNLAECAAPVENVLALLQAMQAGVGSGKKQAAAEADPAPPAAATAADELRQLAKPHLPAGPIKALGAAYWDTEGLGAKLGALLGSKPPPGAEKEHRAGLLAVLGDKLYVVDLCALSGEELTLEKLKQAEQATVTNFRLRALQVETPESATAGALELRGAIEMHAVFPESCGEENPGKAVEIATAIGCS